MGMGLAGAPGKQESGTTGDGEYECCKGRPGCVQEKMELEYHL